MTYQSRGSTEIVVLQAAKQMLKDQLTLKLINDYNFVFEMTKYTLFTFLQNSLEVS